METEDTPERFHRQFQISVASLQEQIDLLPSFSTVGGEQQDAVDHVLSGISQLSNRVADAADFLPAYDQRTYSEAVKDLRDKLNKTTAQFAPRNRFQFKHRTGNATAATAKPDTRRLNPTATPANPVADGAASSSTSKPADVKDSAGAAPTSSSNDNDNNNLKSNDSATATGSKNYNAEITNQTRSGASSLGVRRPSFSTARDIMLSGHSGVHIVVPASASHATSAGSLLDLNRCVIDMTAPTTAAGGSPFASLVLLDISGCAIAAGHVDGPVFVTRVRDSAVVVAARQVRIHDCENVVFYLHCVSRPIIENCKGVRFARAPEAYLTDKEKGETNLFDQVDDFKWLKTTASPNWSLLPESEAIPGDVWKQALAGGPAVAVDDTLRMLGIGKGT
ncbi:1cc65361-e920-4c37-8341-6cb1f088311a [Thermothielavioides terrestris]|uniref:1cc65361-e920-4c37-8341-6cb1f088311a n=1 Tax=Thermothielavioides terrestris TaxID=2587410 RepID=A0A446BQI9_9PEZI|nr:1cc65361-e920-4c37-8341-6cb1f088311a [Thermothielavioides terrestris]